MSAKLISKPAREPIWSPNFENMDKITPKLVQAAFFNLQPGFVDLKLTNSSSYLAYPHHTLSGLPTGRDVRRILSGGPVRGKFTPPPKTKAELMEWILLNWGGYDREAITYGNTKVRDSTIKGGSFQAKVGLKEKCISIMDLHVVETSDGLCWKI